MALEQADLDAVKSMIAEAFKANSESKGNEGNEKDNNDVEKIKADAEKAKSEQETLKSAIAFNLSMGNFIESNKRFIPEGVATVFKAYAGRDFGTEEEKANKHRKVILDEIFGNQKNIDVLPESMKNKVSVYKNLPEPDKIKQAGRYFELVDTFLTIKKGMAQKEFNGTEGNTSSAYSDRFDKLSENFNKKG